MTDATARVPRFRWLQRALHPLLTIASIVLVLVVWQSLPIPLYVLPKPLVIAAQIVADARSGTVWPHVWVTFVEVTAGFAFAVLAGVLLGTFIALNAYVASTIYPFVLAFQTVPKVAIAPLFLIWFGFGIESKIVTAALLAVFPVLVNVIAGLKSVEPRRLLLMESLAASSWETFVKVRLPSMLPYLFAGFEVGIIFAVIGAIVAEFVGASVGLGSLIVQRQANIDLPGVFSVLIYLSVMGLILSLIVQGFTRHFMAFSRLGSKGGAA